MCLESIENYTQRQVIRLVDSLIMVFGVDCEYEINGNEFTIVPILPERNLDNLFSGYIYESHNHKTGEKTIVYKKHPDDLKILRHYIQCDEGDEVILEKEEIARCLQRNGYALYNPPDFDDELVIVLGIYDPVPW